MATQRDPKWRRSAVWLVGAALLLAPHAAFAEPTAALYLGFSVTADEPTIVDGVEQPPSPLCVTRCSSAKSAVGGLRVGYWLERLPWLGFAGDFSAFYASWGIQSPYEIIGYPVTPMVAVRGRLIRQEGFEHGRIQPYLAFGPSMFISTAEVTEGFAAIGDVRTDSSTSVDIGVDFRVGVEILTTDWFGFLIEYRHFWSEPTWKLDGKEVQTTVSTNQLSFGIGAHF